MKIGLALGSGSARGWAHIGVIEALNRLGIHADIIAGCSVGSYVGAVYANDNLSDLKAWVKSLSEWQVAGLMGVGFKRGAIANGEKVFKQLQEFSTPTFELLEKPFGVVATDLYSGKEVWFTHGNVIEAVRASCATPALFPSVWHHGQNRWLVDGALVNPVPVSLCRHLGADFIIGVNLNSDHRPHLRENHTLERQNNQEKTDNFFAKSKSLVNQWLKRDPEEKVQPQSPSMLGTFTGALEIMQARVTRSKLAGEPPEILIEPQLGDFGMMEYHRAQELIDEGHASVERLEQQIKYQLGLS
ncbi:patatin-like phospholipase RssA [Thalassomonas viridans]|uniref:Patatin-like phospholipase RssA n=1 Tax=Thalassomonas viridans TaxID=137584 RepID=A0AAE9YZQ8_9GAMM|nr:patatin-like phospholipase RssA [Thalassomonas viridans]WDE03379.1 patatin-like phospholipase RssA [Thalassomonas viridans]